MHTKENCLWMSDPMFSKLQILRLWKKDTEVGDSCSIIIYSKLVVKNSAKQ